MTLGKVSPLLSQNIDPLNITKRVYWRPVTATTVIKVGQPVCYNSDETKDYKERSTTPISGGTAYAEGSQNYTARLFCVEEPLTANLMSFAGIVIKLGTLAGADGDLIEIATPVPGAVVPVYTDIECTVNQTLIGLRDSEADASYPQYAKIIGVARETKDRSGTAGLVWMEFVDIIEQGDYTYPYIIPDESAGDVILNHQYFQSVQTAGAFHLLKARVELTGNAGFEGGMVQYRGEINGVDPATSQVMSIGLTIKASGELATTGYQYGTCPLHLGIGTSGTPDLSGGGLANTLCAISISYNADESGGAPGQAYVFHFNSGTYVWDGLIHAMSAGDIGDSSQSGTAANVVGFDGDGTIRKIPVRLGGVTYYLLVGTAAAETAD